MKLKKCEHEGCNVTGQLIRCLMPDYDNHKFKTWRYYYCSEHCHEHGFCWGCGHFYGGCNDFDFSQSGLCDNCKDDPDFGFVEENEDDYYESGYDNVDTYNLPEEE